MNTENTPIRVPNYLVGSILATLFCCLPTGIASIVFASRANSKAAAGDTHGALQDASKASLWLWLSVIPGILFMVIGVFAAVALPAYQDYTVRAKVSEAILAGSSVKTAYTEFVAEHHAWPSVEDLDLNRDALYQAGRYALTINDDHAIEITMEGKSGAKDKTVLLVPTVVDGEITDWTCTAGTMPQKYLPASCRGQ